MEKVNSLLQRSSCLATAKTLLFHIFKSSLIPVSTWARADKADCVESAHITFSVVMVLKFFIILHLVVNTILAPRNSFSFFTLLPGVPAFLEAPARWERRLNKRRRSKGTCFHL